MCGIHISNTVLMSVHHISLLLYKQHDWNCLQRKHSYLIVQMDLDIQPEKNAIILFCNRLQSDLIHMHILLGHDNDISHDVMNTTRCRFYQLTAVSGAILPESWLHNGRKAVRLIIELFLFNCSSSIRRGGRHASHDIPHTYHRRTCDNNICRHSSSIFDRRQRTRRRRWRRWRWFQPLRQCTRLVPACEHLVGPTLLNLSPSLHTQHSTTCLCASSLAALLHFVSTDWLTNGFIA